MFAPATRRAQQKQATRGHLFDVAMRLFDHRGYDAVNIDDIVRASKVARGTFYFHFPSKEDILYEAVRRGEREIVKRMAAVSEDQPFREVLAATCDGFAATWGERRELLVEAGMVGLKRTISTARAREEEPLRLELVRHVERALAKGELGSVLPAQMLADVFLLNVFAALMAWAPTGEPSLGVVMPGVIDLFLRGAEGFGAPPRSTRRKRKLRSARR
ncbi:MAG TPA: helix-turn-helix domain-containing protein [Polyangiaceae bacterium]|jgi:AcrR family transcriptional regulator|nr:helix-turn-helix domain-containing protein [Polyangiaceae bacterium]